MFHVQTNYFAGDATFINDFIELDTFQKCLDYIMENLPPEEYEWDVREDGKGGAIAWTRYSGRVVEAWIDGKIVTLRALQTTTL